MAHSLQLLAEKYSQIKKTAQHVESRTVPKYSASEFAHPQHRLLPRFGDDVKKEEVRIAEEILKAIKVGDMKTIESLAQELLNMHVA